MSILGDTPSAEGTAQETAADKSAAELFAEAEDTEEGATETDASDASEEVGEAESEEAPEADEATEEETQEADEANEDESSDEPAPESLKVEIDGQSLTLEEVKKGYLRQADYTRKTQDLAKERNEFAGAVDRLEQQDRLAVDALEFANSVIAAVVPKAPDIALLQTDPHAYLLQKEQHEAALKILNEFKTKRGAVSKQQEMRKGEMTQEQLNREMKVLSEKLPELTTADGKAKFRNDALKYAEKWGYTPGDIDSIQSARELALMKDAIAFRKLQSQKMSAVAKVKQSPKIVKPGSRATPDTPMSKLKKLGSAARARDIFAAMEEG
jgi:hypothetical protein